MLYLRYITRYYSKAVTKKMLKYTNTLNLPKTKFPSRLSPIKRKEIEKSLNEKCFHNVYTWQREHLNSASEFVLHDGPPYANGNLHMGHSVNKILKDITLRKHVINNIKIHYKPGWDCHGLPIELKSLTTSKSTDPLDIRIEARKLALEAMHSQKNDFQSWGVIADFNNSDNMYRTIDANYVKNELKLFYNLFCKKLLYRDYKPIYWSPSSKTALAEAELEYDNNFISPSLTLQIKLAHLSNQLKLLVGENYKNIFLTIWTTTPWTLVVNQAVCFNPDISYSLIQFNDRMETNDVHIVATDLLSELKTKINSDYKELTTFIGTILMDCTYYHPITKSMTCPVLPAKYVTITKGTGLVHTAPAHGLDDYLLSLQYNIPLKCIVNDEGNYNSDAPAHLQNKYVLTDGNELILKDIQEDIIHLGKITHSYPIDWRTKQPVIILASKQWFINTEKLKDRAIEEIKSLTMYPKSRMEISQSILTDQLAKRPYWCISRQRVWGTPIPVFYNRKTDEIIINSEIIEHLCKLFKNNNDIDKWWTSKIEDLLPLNYLSKLGLTTDDIEKGKDILDIWFDSGISWSYALDTTTQADLYLEGHDQFTGWFQSSLLTSLAAQNKPPYKSIFVHGFVVDENGRKMSKSIGNVIYPSEIIEKYGTDTLRWWIAAHSTQHTTICISNKILEDTYDIIQKLRNTLKYIVGCLELPSNLEQQQLISNMNQLPALDKYFLNLLQQFEETVANEYNQYQYNRVTALILNFIVNDLSGLYFNLIKDRLYCGTDQEFQSIKWVLTHTFYTLNKVLWPITPYLVEECWSYYDDSKPFYQFINVNKSTGYKESNNDYSDFNVYLDLRDKLHQQCHGVNTWTIDLMIECNGEMLNIFKKLHPIVNVKLADSELCEILQVSSLKLISDTNNESYNLHVTPINDQLCNRCRRFIGKTELNLCDRCDTVLNDKIIE